MRHLLWGSSAVHHKRGGDMKKVKNIIYISFKMEEQDPDDYDHNGVNYYPTYLKVLYNLKDFTDINDKPLNKITKWALKEIMSQASKAFCEYQDELNCYGTCRSYFVSGKVKLATQKQFNFKYKYKAVYKGTYDFTKKKVINCK